MRSLRQLMDLSGRKALLTGGAGHIGLSAAEALLECGATVAILDVDKAACERRVEELSRLAKGEAAAFSCDLLDERETRRVVRQAGAALGGLDIVMHCAAYGGATVLPGWSVPLEQQTVEAWDAAMRVNLTAAFVIAQEGREFLTVSGRGTIILMSSIYGLVGPDLQLYANTPMGNPAGYHAAKGGLLQLTRYLATVFAPRIRVNAISPGGVWRNQPDVFHERYVSRTPLGRMATEEDLKGAVAYLASDLSAYVTGHNLIVDGGWTAW